MRVLLTFITIAFFNLVSFSQTFNGTGTNIPASSITPTCFNINVTGVGVINTTTQGLASVCLNITHPDVGDLEITLTAPDGTMVPLSIQNGGTGNNYTNTCFTATATNSIKFGTAPYTGSFLPEGWLGAVNNGQNANGTWRLCVRDRRGGSSGSLSNWSLTFNNTPAPMPPPRPSCANTLPSNSSCSNATLVCDFNGQCGTTSGNSIQDWPGSGLDGDCFGLNNNSFIKFIASATTATFSVWVPTTSQTLQQGGVQMLFFSGTCNSGPVTVHGCYPRILPYSSSGQPLVSLITANNLTPGNTYYLMIDGANGDNTTFTIAANTGVNVLNITPAAPSICQGSSVNLTATGGNGVYAWSPATNLSATSGATVTATPAGTITYTVASTTATGCPLTKDVTVTVNPRPATPTATAVPPNCTSPNGSITITAPLGAGFQYSVNGGPYQSSPVFNTNIPGGASYSVTVRDGNGCESLPLTVLVPAACVAPLPTVTTIAPGCTVTTGTATVTSPLGANYVYSLYLVGNPIVGPQASPIFTGLVPGNYVVIVQDVNTNCCNTTSFTLTAATPPTAATGTVTQPSCTVTTGSITITAPVGAGFQYSINGGPYQASPIFTGLAAGATYNITVQNAAGCPSAPTPFVVNALPPNIQAPTVTITQPTCTTPTGTITVTAPLGAGLLYSIGGPFQASPIFTGLTQNVYNVVVQNGPGCTSQGTSASVNAAPTLPAAPTGTITQPTCTTPTGTITITAPVGAGLQYSINGGAYQSSPVFAGLNPNSYTITVQNAGCTSPASQPFVVSAPPSAPAAPTGTIVQPTCTTPTGTITITAPVGAGLQYSINGGAYQSSPVFAGLNPNSYTITVQNAGCTSPASQPFVLNTPTPVSITTTVIQPDCNNAAGTITITSPLGVNYVYGIRNTATSILTGPQASPVFTNVTPGEYLVLGQSTGNTTCLTGTLVTINAAPVVPVAPTGTITQPTCTTPTGTITITAPVGAGLQYSINGGAFQTSAIFAGLAPGNTYNITVQNAVCTSGATAFVVNTSPIIPVRPTLNVLQPNCIRPDGLITVTFPLGAGFEYNINGGAFQTNPVFPPILVQGSYDIRVRNAAGCESLPETVVINLPQAQPAKPVIAIIQPVCPTLTGTITVTSPTGTDIEYSRNGTTYQSSNIFLNVPAGTYNITARFVGTTCISASTTATINRLTAADCTTGTDIYFPSAFTPDGDGLNETFGPGPRSSLSLVTNYTLLIYNRFGELVFKSNNPLQQWNGSYKGKVSGNFSYTWTATYRFNGRPLQTKKGTVTIVR